MNRRNFIKNIAKAGAVLGFPTIIPASALGKDGTVAPSNRVTMGSIGLGNMGCGNTRGFQSDKRVQLVALCDVNNAKDAKFYNYNNNVERGVRGPQAEMDKAPRGWSAGVYGEGVKG